MGLKKKIVITVNGYNVRLSNQLKFYQNDQLELIFEINEYGVIVEGETSTHGIMPINPLNATLFFETPTGIDSVKSASIVDNTLTFYLSNDHTQYIGISRMQIQLTDGDGCQITLPEFEFEIRKNIYDGQLEIVDVVLYDELSDSILIDENNNLIIIDKTKI